MDPLDISTDNRNLRLSDLENLLEVEHSNILIYHNINPNNPDNIGIRPINPIEITDLNTLNLKDLGTQYNMAYNDFIDDVNPGEEIDLYLCISKNIPEIGYYIYLMIDGYDRANRYLTIDELYNLMDVFLIQTMIYNNINIYNLPMYEGEAGANIKGDE